ncbi:MAG TPA: biotin/lipoyl-binding protein [Pirellulaceae bacterium]|nr:biotin/lipoyl-binding protein [Pirellulaceae bacterium]HMO93902.1 biotin/lipoyl-binding protein [Pirellulaceae bacterium]HMP71504.1 biotin/lipoyl-binding protein [Pirellulaceae bacterium]
MRQTSLVNKLTRALRTFKYPLVVAIIAGVVWYVRSQPIPVVSHTVWTGPVVHTVMGTGTLEARIRTTISPKIQGRIAEVLVDQGSVVKAGQLLVRLDDDDLAQQVRMATAGISSSEATLGRFRAEIAQAKSTFAKTEADLGRTQKLLNANSISQSEGEPQGGNHKGTFYFFCGLRSVRMLQGHAHQERHEVVLFTMS